MQALQEVQIDQNVDERILIGDGFAVAQMRTLNAQVDRLCVDAFQGGALVISELIGLTVTVKGVAQARADAERCERRVGLSNGSS